MKKILILFVALTAFLLSSCGALPGSLSNKPYSLSWENNRLIVTMPRPSIGIAGPNVVNWGDVKLDDVINDIYSELKDSDLQGNVEVWVRFNMESKDQYGNEKASTEEHQIAVIPIAEAQKYKSGYFLDKYYKISSKIENASCGENILSAMPVNFNEEEPQAPDYTTEEEMAEITSDLFDNRNVGDADCLAYPEFSEPQTPLYDQMEEIDYDQIYTLEEVEPIDITRLQDVAPPESSYPYIYE